MDTFIICMGIFCRFTGKLSLTLLLTMGTFWGLSSQEISYLQGFLYAPWNGSMWETSYSIPAKDPAFLDAIAVPFRFPSEISLIYSYVKNVPSNSRPGQSSSFREHLRPVNEGIYPWLSLGWEQRGYAFLYRRKNFGLSLDISFLVTGNLKGLPVADTMESKARFSYRLPLESLGWYRKDTHLDLFLELMELQGLPTSQSASQNPASSSIALFKSGENIHKPGLFTKQLYASPGFSLSRSSSLFAFEGQVRVPMNSREANRTLDDLWTPEIQTQFGMKYTIPVAGLE